MKREYSSTCTQLLFLQWEDETQHTGSLCNWLQTLHLDLSYFPGVHHHLTAESNYYSTTSTSTTTKVLIHVQSELLLLECFHFMQLHLHLHSCSETMLNVLLLFITLMASGAFALQFNASLLTSPVESLSPGYLFLFLVLRCESALKAFCTNVCGTIKCNWNPGVTLWFWVQVVTWSCWWFSLNIFSIRLWRLSSGNRWHHTQAVTNTVSDDITQLHSLKYSEVILWGTCVFPLAVMMQHVICNITGN